MAFSNFQKLCSGLALLVSVSCAGPVTFNSGWRENEIAINGLDDDWEGKMKVVEGERIGIGIRNDSKYLYFCLAPLDRPTAMQIMTTGLTIWFDSTGSRKKAVGVRFPLGFQENVPAIAMMPPNNKKDRDKAMADAVALDEVELLWSDGWDRRRLKVSELSGLFLKLTQSDNGMFYEMRVPLHDDDLFGIQTSPGKMIGIGIETGEFKKLAHAPEGGVRLGPGGGGGMAGGRGPGPARGRMEMPKRIALWLETTLAETH